MLDLEPKSVWKHFSALSRIPRCSGNEKAAREYVMNVAAQLGLSYDADEQGNVVVRKPPVGKGEGAPGVVLQAHMDMVCEKTPDSDHDFERDPLIPMIEEGWVRASGTSLGADNGVGLAAGLAILEESDLEHPPLELLATVEEEVGLKGAGAVSSDFVNGRMLINLDGEEEGKILIGCAGGVDLVGERTMPCLPHVMMEGSAFRVVVDGLSGGHSGIDIDKGRGNAIKIMTHALLTLCRGQSQLLLVSFRGGSKPNAIPRYAEAEFFLPGAAEPAALTQWAESATKEWRSTLAGRDSKVTLSVEPTETDKLLVTAEATRRLLEFLVASSHGVLAVDPELGRMVETSANLAIVESANGRFTVLTSVRSSRAAELSLQVTKVEALMKLLAMETRRESEYPAWTREPDSPLLAAALRAHEDVLGTPARATTIHAGLECGILADRLPGLTAISIGPKIVSPHSPDERIEIQSVERFWSFLRGLLRNLAVRS
jgi:dipeptidase D